MIIGISISLGICISISIGIGIRIDIGFSIRIGIKKALVLASALTKDDEKTTCVQT